MLSPGWSAGCNIFISQFLVPARERLAVQLQTVYFHCCSPARWDLPTLRRGWLQYRTCTTNIITRCRYQYKGSALFTSLQSGSLLSAVGLFDLFTAIHWRVILTQSQSTEVLFQLIRNISPFILTP